MEDHTSQELTHHDDKQTVRGYFAIPERGLC